MVEVVGVEEAHWVDLFGFWCMGDQSQLDEIYYAVCQEICESDAVCTEFEPNGECPDETKVQDWSQDLTKHSIEGLIKICEKDSINVN